MADATDSNVSNRKQGSKNKTGKKTLWVNVFRCACCGKEAWHKMPKCRQCGQAYYCDATCQRKHWQKHKPVCQATVADLDLAAHRRRLAQAAQENADEETRNVFFRKKRSRDKKNSKINIVVWVFAFSYETPKEARQVLQRARASASSR